MQIDDISIHEPVALEEMPKYDLFLSQVTDLLNEYFPDERFTGNIVQNYIKSEVITKPIHGKKRGYTRMHLIQLVFLCYMRPILTTDDIKKVFSLAFNEINQPEDDIITWEDAYRIFLMIYHDTHDAANTVEWTDDKIDGILMELHVKKENLLQVRRFIKVLILITMASNIKREVRSIVNAQTPAEAVHLAGSGSVN